MKIPKRPRCTAPRQTTCIARWLLLSAGLPALSAHAAQIELTPPIGSVKFGTDVIVLPNGNIVVRDDEASIPAIKAGAVHLFSPTGTLISTLRGASANDQIGNWGIRVLDNGHFVVVSRYWDNGAVADAGAVTWCSASTGCAGMVSSANSLIGSSVGDQVGSVLSLRNGHYLVLSSFWKNGANHAGAVTWCNGTGGCSGPVSPANSLIGGAADYVGSGGLALANGHAVVVSSSFDNGAASNAGAVTWINGNSGLVGTVSAANSIVGSSTGDQIGNGGLVALSNGHYVIVSHWFDNGAAADAGAVTWANGSAATAGTVNASNSILGTSAGDAIGSSRVLALANGHYVINSGRVDINGVGDAGASTWVNGSGPTTGTVSAANSLYGTTTMDRVAEDGAVLLANGHYVVRSQQWDNGAVVNAGAVTFGNGGSGITGPVSSANSLVGSSANDNVGYPYPLANGHYVVFSQFWDNGAAVDAGANAWCNGNTGCSGPISVANALVGTAGSPVSGITPLSDGNYVVRSPDWDNGALLNVGAATWASGSTGLSGTVSVANSLVGLAAGDRTGRYVYALTQGAYLVGSPFWDNGALLDVGAVTWCGAGGKIGSVSMVNSLVGVLADDQFGVSALDPLPDGRAVIQSEYFDQPPATDSGATTLLPLGGMTGIVPASHSVLGTVTDEGSALYYGYDQSRGQLAVGHGPANRVTLLSLTPDERKIFRDSFE